MKQRFHILSWLGAVAVASTAGGALALPPAPDTRPTAVARPTTSIERGGCVTTECHPGIKAQPFAHGPVSVDACDACHQELDPRQHTFTLPRTGPEMCAFCHQLDLQGETVHQPVAEGQCIECHDPHGGTNRFMLRGGTGAASCAQCHEDVTGGQPVVHGPVAAGACTACHRPHSSAYPKLLNYPGPELCLECHQTLWSRLDAVRTVHGPVAAECTACHLPHASEHKMMLKKETTALCLECHADIAKLAEEAPVHHDAVSTGAACRNCHDPHGSDFPAILNNDMVEVCLGCHDHEIEMPDGTRLGNMRAELAPGRTLHGPIAQHNCAACHQVHGSQNFRLLIQEYPAAFYAPFRTETYALCFACHDRQLFSEPVTDQLTNFRNGDQNLHYLHVNKESKGRTCRACHETHASDRPKHIRESVPFGTGGWKLPINFEISPTGGRCSPGCHRPYGYDRVNPVDNAPPGKAAGAARPRPGAAPGKAIPKQKGGTQP